MGNTVEPLTVIYFTNGRMIKIPTGKAVYIRLGERSDVEYSPDTSGGKIAINWDNVAFCREWIEPEEYDV